MALTTLQRLFRPFKDRLPAWAWRPLRALATALLTPALFSYRSGHFASSLREVAVDRKLAPIPWYTYPCIEFLQHRDFSSRLVLEFGGGQSTLWWAERAKAVVTIEEDRCWHDALERRVPSNVELHHVALETCIAAIPALLHGLPHAKYDVVVIDGLERRELIGVALQYVADHGIIIFDDSDGYGFFAETSGIGLNRADFFGMAPGVHLQHCTSILFGPDAFAFSSRHPIPAAAAL